MRKAREIHIQQKSVKKIRGAIKERTRHHKIQEAELAINTFQADSFSSTAAFTSSFHHTLFGYFPLLSMIYTPCTINYCPFHLSPICSTLLSLSHSTLSLSRDIAYPVLYRYSLSFSLLILLDPSTTFLPLIHVLTNLNLHSTTW